MMLGQATPVADKSRMLDRLPFHHFRSLFHDHQASLEFGVSLHIWCLAISNGKDKLQKLYSLREE